MCSDGRLPTPYTLRVSVQASVLIAQNLDFIDCGPFCEGKWIWNSEGTFDLNATCSSSPQKHCNVGYTEEFRFLDAPVEVTADKDTTTLGNYTSTFTNTCAGGDLSALALSIGESIRDELTATLNITSRPSCQTVECSCNSLTIYGTAWTFSQGGLTREYAWGDEQAEWGDSPYYIYWDGVGTFYLTRYDPDSYVTGIGGLMTEFHVVEFSCSTINGVPTWTATITSECFQYDNVPNQTHHSTDTWVGSIECYEACPDEWHGDGAPIPIGELVDVEYLGRTTEPGYSACDPPARVTVSGRQVIAPC